MVNSPNVLVNAIVVRAIFYLKIVFYCSSTQSLNNGPLVYYMKYYVYVEQKDHLCPRGFQRERTQGANRK